jgi:flagellar biosynthesis protein FliQ
MDQAFIIDFAMESIKTTLLLSAPMLGFGLVTGLAVSMVDAVDVDLHFENFHQLP